MNRLIAGPIGTVLNDVHQERLRQIATWGDQTHDPDRWLAILIEELGEVSMDINDGASDERIREELIQVAAVAVAWVEDLDR